MPGTLALDISSRNCGWAFASGSTRPVHGLWLLPGIADMGKLGAAFRNALEDAITVHKPDRLVFAPALFSVTQTSARALIGLAFLAEMVAYDCGVRPFEIAEATARKQVLGSPVMSAIARAGRAKKGAGSDVAKDAAMAWARNRGFSPQSHDTADALVLLEYDRLWRLSRRQWGEAA